MSGPPLPENRDRGSDLDGPGTGAGRTWTLAPRGGRDGPRSHLLNPYQRNALGSILPIAERAVRLAAAELAAVDERNRHVIRWKQIDACAYVLPCRASQSASISSAPTTGFNTTSATGASS
ncbi:MAG: hypothetical protein HY332_13325 [Chloroflexi bacterium]|nr:hypothetical protein [Chloroflexota bacterium]